MNSGPNIKLMLLSLCFYISSHLNEALRKWDTQQKRAVIKWNNIIIRLPRSANKATVKYDIRA